MHRTNRLIGFGIITAAAMAMSTGLADAATELTLVNGFPKNLPMTTILDEDFVAKVNAAGKGIVQIRHIGGPEVTPPRKAGAALMRGVIDMLETPTSYYAGLMPEGYVFTGANRTPAELRANGAYDLINKYFATKLNARLIAWGNSDTGFYLYLTHAPKRTAGGGIDLTGLKLRSSPTYVPLINALGGVPVSMSASEIYTGLQRDVIQGFGWTDVGVHNLGVKGIVKYRIDPRFYRANTVTIINLDKWKALPEKAKKILDDAGKAYEVESVGLFAAEAKKDAAGLEAAGMKIITLKGPVAARYLKLAYDGLWARLGTLVPASEVATLRSKFYAH